jgi:stage II sporulation protein AA (anti-sigma F factor antagonist)
VNEHDVHVSASEVDGVTSVTIAGEIDLGNAQSVQEQLDLATGDSDVVVVDLRQVTYIDSRGIRLLVDLSRRLRSRGGGLSVIAPKDTVAGGVLRLMHIEELELRDA